MTGDESAGAGKGAAAAMPAPEVKAPSRRLRIAYLCDISPLNRDLYSGGNARMYDALRAHVGDVDILSNTWGLAEPIRWLMHKLPEALNLRLRWRMHLLLGRLTARAVRRELDTGDFDVLFAAYSFQSLHRVVPPPGMLTIYTADATPTVYRNSLVGESFGSYFTPSRLLDPWITRAEARTFRATDLCLWPSHWLRRAADTLYGLDPAQSLTLPWGANLDEPPQDARPVPLSGSGPVQLLFVGRDWFAKGGPITLDVLKQLRARGIDARLTVIGCTPPGPLPEDAVTVYPSLDKSVPADLALFEAAFRQAHFLVLPSLESFGFAFCEASAYGLPSLCFDTGGVPVREDRNGHAFGPDTPPEGFAETIAAYVEDPKSYDVLRIATRAEFDTRLNWDAWGIGVAALVAEQSPTAPRA